MADTGGYEVVAEIGRETLRQVLLAARKSNVIPQGITITDPVAFGPYLTDRVEIRIPEVGLDADLVPASNAIRITIPVEADVAIANPPVPSASLFEMTANLRVDAPVGNVTETDDEPKIGLLLEGIGLDAIDVELTSGNPIPAITDDLIAEFVHARWEDETIPHAVSIEGASGLGLTFDVLFQTFDDEADPAKQIGVTSAGDEVTISIPVSLHLSNITGALPVPSPLAIDARIVLTAALDTSPGVVRADLSDAVVTVEDVQPGPGIGGTNYSFVSGQVGPLMVAQLEAQATALARAVGVIDVAVPTVESIEDFIAVQLQAELSSRGDIGVWTPDYSSDEVEVNDATPKVLADALAIAINATAAADLNRIDNFIPADRDFAVAIEGNKVEALLREQRDKPEDEGGLGGIPQTRDIEGKDVRINSLDFNLRDGAIRADGDVTVIDAVAGSIDIDADFWADIGLSWEDEDGGQVLEPEVIDDDVDLSLGAWLVAILLGFIVGGLIIGIIILVVYLVVEDLAESIGSSIAEDEASGRVVALGAWPTNLEGIGEVESRFLNPVIIEEDAIVFAGSITVVSMFALTASAPPTSNGPYFTLAANPLIVSGGTAVTSATYDWLFGDGESRAGIDASNVYTHSGVYVSRLGSDVADPGGVSLGDLTTVKVQNVPAAVTIDGPSQIDEGEVFTLIVNFTDPEWLDTHEAVIDFGDDTSPVLADVEETNEAPRGQGRAVVERAYCDNGIYTIRAQVIDSDGGVGVATHQIEVMNVAPKVDAPERFYAYPCAPVTLIAPFTDPGWCDEHEATWDFGDCSPVIDATIRSRNEPPAGIGYAAATHIYQECGRYEAVVTVTDDDGAATTDVTIVEVIDLENAELEDGFRQLPVGQVANGWEPTGSGEYRAEHSILMTGRAAQALAPRQATAGIRQTIGANPGWDYQFTAHCHRPDGGAMAVGIDPAGGTDPAGPDVVWRAAVPTDRWQPLTVRANAEADRVTVFVMAAAAVGSTDERGGPGYIDHLVLVPSPCPLPELPAPDEPEPTEVCIDWKGEKAPADLGPVHERERVCFVADDERLRLVNLGSFGTGLHLPDRFLQIYLPERAESVSLSFVVRGAGTITLGALDDNGELIGTVESADSSGPVRTMSLATEGSNHLVVAAGRKTEAALIRLCWTPIEHPPLAARARLGP